MVFKHYSFNSIRDKADEVRSQYWKGNKIPVDIDKIIEFGFGLEVRPVAGLKSQLDIEGMLSNDLSVIFVDNNMFSDARFESRLRFTLAHELGHLILHREFYESVEFKSPEDWFKLMEGIDQADLSWYETHANEFAGRLLVPPDHLENEIKSLQEDIEKVYKKAKEQGLGEETDKWVQSFVANKISSKFHVSPQTIETRLRREKTTLLK
ncbi:MAG: ImmA/IrrE family metallo-endopeptidase [Flammeovirgaceae bacterium]|nr:MAG: ImmA/IrrE family metallo-endopeptidase [Flammeovirgaceae bacterium]